MDAAGKDGEGPGYAGVSTSEMKTLGSYWVKGGSIASKLDFLRDELGPEAESGLQDFLDQRGAPQILEASWYPFQLYDEVLRYLVEEHFGGDVAKLRRVGRYSARRSLTGTYSVYVRPGGFPAFLERSASFHGRYYSAGSLELAEASDDGRHFRLVQKDAPIYTRPDLEVACGFYCEAAEMMGLSDVRCEWEYTDDGVAFELDAS